jgi:hypothetical protein
MPSTPQDNFDDDYDLEDDYEEIYLEDATYADTDWDALDPALVHLHDSILEMTQEQLLLLELPALPDDVHRWAAARAWLSHDALDTFLRITRQLLEAPNTARSALLSYPDLRLEYALRLAAQDLTGALAALEPYAAEPNASPLELARHRALIHLDHGDPEAGLQLMLQAAREHSPKTPRAGLDLAEDLLQRQRLAMATRLLDATRARALELDMHDIADEAEDMVSIYKLLE